MTACIYKFFDVFASLDNVYRSYHNYDTYNNIDSPYEQNLRERITPLHRQKLQNTLGRCIAIFLQHYDALTLDVLQYDFLKNKTCRKICTQNSYALELGDFSAQLLMGREYNKPSKLGGLLYFQYKKSPVHQALCDEDRHLYHQLSPLFLHLEI